MVHGLFITGTDTHVGKTVVAAALMHRYRHVGNLRYWKPIQTGMEHDDDTATVRHLGACRETELLISGVRLRGAFSPHHSADLAGTTIELNTLRRLIADQKAAQWVIEGAGGVLVPINKTRFMIDFMASLSLPVLVVARSTLGTINHTLLTLEALRSRNLEVAGVVMVGERNDSNRQAIERYGSVSILGNMPLFPTLAPETLNLWAASNLDRESLLAKYLQ